MDFREIANSWFVTFKGRCPNNIILWKIDRVTEGILKAVEALVPVEEELKEIENLTGAIEKPTDLADKLRTFVSCKGQHYIITKRLKVLAILGWGEESYILHPYMLFNEEIRSKHPKALVKLTKRVQEELEGFNASNGNKHMMNMVSKDNERGIRLIENLGYSVNKQREIFNKEMPYYVFSKVISEHKRR